MRKSVKKRLSAIRRQLKEYAAFAASEELAQALRPGADDEASEQLRQRFDAMHKALEDSCRGLVSCVDYSAELTAHRAGISARMEDKLEKYLLKVISLSVNINLTRLNTAHL